MLFLQILSPFLLGIIDGAIPGPILTSSFTEAFRKGFIKSLRIIIIATIVESAIASIILALFFSIKVPQIVFYIISFIGAGVIVNLAFNVWKIKDIGGEGEVFTFKKIFLLQLSSGHFYIFWITICVPQAFLLGKLIPGGSVLFLILFEIGWFLGTFALTFIFSRFRKYLIKKNYVSFVFKLFALLLLLFSLKIVIESSAFLLKNLF